LQHASTFLRLFLALLSLKRDGKFLPQRLLQLSINFVHTAVEHASMFKIVKAELGWLLFGLIFPLVCFDDVLLLGLPRLFAKPCGGYGALRCVSRRRTPCS
jgi:hypothetical protein